MIERYSRKELREIWLDQNRYKIWLDVELAAAEAMEKLKIIPRGVVKKVKSKSKINVDRISNLEGKVRHDVIAFLASITEKVGKEGSFLHKGMTSSDVLDTCFNLQLKQSGLIILKDLENLLKSIKKQSLKHKYTLCIGRSHGIHAEPTTFGLKLLTFYEEFSRNHIRLENEYIGQQGRTDVSAQFNGESSYVAISNPIKSTPSFTMFCTFEIDSIEPSRYLPSDEFSILSFPGFDTALTYTSFHNFNMTFTAANMTIILFSYG